MDEATESSVRVLFVLEESRIAGQQETNINNRAVLCTAIVTTAIRISAK